MLLQAQGESVIRKALTELQLWGLQCSFAFVSSSDATAAASTGAGGAHGSRGVPLIKDWAGVLSEVGDHQSLVASLKSSPYYAMFKVCLAASRFQHHCACIAITLSRHAPFSGPMAWTSRLLLQPPWPGACEASLVLFCVSKLSPGMPLQDEVLSWETRLTTLLEGLTLLQAIQRRWLYLEPIFGRGALPAVAGRFRHVDGEFKAIMLQLQVRGQNTPHSR